MKKNMGRVIDGDTGNTIKQFRLHDMGRTVKAWKGGRNVVKFHKTNIYVFCKEPTDEVFSKAVLKATGELRKAQVTH